VEVTGGNDVELCLQSTHGMKHILIVDDDDLIRTALAEALTLAGYKVTMAGEREEAEALLATQQYDLVITDLLLGDLSGFSGLQVLSDAAHRIGAKRVLAMTGQNNHLVESAVREVGSELLKKPFRMSSCISICDAKVR
jgi:DNA-binding response OmpR family regulator